MVSLGPELSKLLLMSTSAPFGSQNGPTFSNFLKRKLETSFLQHESKIKDSLRFFPDNVLLMMMRAFPPSAATASGFGSGLGSGSQSKNRRSYLKLILCCFLPNSCPHTKFHPNWTKNIEVKMISYRLASVGWSGQ